MNSSSACNGRFFVGEKTSRQLCVMRLYLKLSLIFAANGCNPTVTSDGLPLRV